MAEPTDIPIQDEYTQQIAAVLETNRRQQAELRSRLERLAAHEELLSGILEPAPAPRNQEDTPAGAPPAPAERQDATPTADEAAVLPPQIEEPAASPAPANAKAAKRTPAKPAAKKAAATTTAKSAAANKAAEPTLGDLLVRVLDKRPQEPHTAIEVTTALEHHFPQRARNVKIVRNTLENLLAKSRIERTKQGSTVYYSSLPSASQPAAAKTDSEPSAEAEKAPATA